MARNVRCRLTIGVSQEEKRLFALFNQKGQKGTFYDDLYKDLKNYFEGKMSPPQISLKHEQRAVVRLWFDMDMDLDSQVRSDLLLCNHSDDTKAIVKSAVMKFAKNRQPGLNHAALAKEASSLKKPKTQKPPKGQETPQAGSSSKPKKDSKPLPDLSRLTFDDSLDGDARLDLLSHVLAGRSDISPSSISAVKSWAKVIEKYLGGTPFKASTAQALVVAGDEKEWVYDFIANCPYLKELAQQAIFKHEKNPEEHVVEHPVKVQSNELDNDASPKEKDFTDILMGISN